MADRKKTGKYIGWTGAVLVHVLLVCFLFLMSFQRPLPGEESGMPVMLGDAPDAGGFSDPSLVDVEVMPRGMSLSKFHSRLDEFLRLVTEVFGKRPMIYTGKNFYNRYFADTNFRKYLFMIACYTVDEPELDNNDDYIIWQYTCKGRVDGVRGNVDISKIMGHHSLKEIMY